MNTNLNELFALPINAKQVAVFDSKIKLYTSAYLINQYSNALASSKYTANAYDIIKNMILSKKIIPVYMNKNIFSYAFTKFYGNDNIISSSLAFYDPSSDKIYILISSNTTLGFVSNNWIAKLTIHELMHMACAYGKDKFKNLFINEYRNFYNIFFHLMADADITDKSSKSILKDVDKYIDIFHKIEVHKGNLSNGVLKTGPAIFKNVLIKLNTSKKLTNDYIYGYKYILFMYLKYGISGLKQATQHDECVTILRKLKMTYKVLTNDKINTLAIQELIFPSEIIAVLSETKFILNKTPIAIKMIKI